MEPPRTPTQEPDEPAQDVETTWLTAPQRRSAGQAEACLVHIYPTGPVMGTRYKLGDAALVIGRGEDCDLRIPDFSVSRKHAAVEARPDGYHVADLGSTNGTFLNDTTVSNSRMQDGDYLRVGNCIYRFLAGGNVEADYHEEIYRLTIIDALTQVPNRRYLTEFVDRELVRALRHARPLSLLMIDIDRFKSVNDDFGHLAGDFTLRELAACVRQNVSREDLFARYGGEEFAMVLVETTPDQARRVAEQVRQVVEGHTFRFDDAAYPVTVSIGLAGIEGGPKELTVEELFRRADANLYQAKNAGRNRVVG
jgi:two-component system, cell cycle response regulator